MSAAPRPLDIRQLGLRGAGNAYTNGTRTGTCIRRQLTSLESTGQDMARLPAMAFSAGGLVQPVDGALSWGLGLASLLSGCLAVLAAGGVWACCEVAA